MRVSEISFGKSPGVFEMISHQNGMLLQPAELQILGSAYDEAWSTLANEIPHEEDCVRQARTQLAFIMLELAKLDQLHAEELRHRAIRIFRDMTGTLGAT